MLEHPVEHQPAFLPVTMPLKVTVSGALPEIGEALNVSLGTLVGEGDGEGVGDADEPYTLMVAPV